MIRVLCFTKRATPKKAIVPTDHGGGRRAQGISILHKVHLTYLTSRAATRQIVRFGSTWACDLTLGMSQALGRTARPRHGPARLDTCIREWPNKLILIFRGFVFRLMETCPLRTPLFLSVIAALTSLLLAVSSVLEKLTPLLTELRHWIF